MDTQESSDHCVPPRFPLPVLPRVLREGVQGHRRLRRHRLVLGLRQVLRDGLRGLRRGSSSRLRVRPGVRSTTCDRL